MQILLTILMVVAEILFPASGKASWYDDGDGFYAAVHSYTWGDPTYQVEVCRADDQSICTLVTIRDHMESLDKAIDLGPDAFVELWPQYDPSDPDERALALSRGVVDVTIERSDLAARPLPATDAEPSCIVTR